MGNQSALPERTFDALNFLALTDADFKRADKDRNGKLSAAELLKLLRTKEYEMKHHANTLKQITLADCQQLCDAKLSDQKKFVNYISAEAERRRQVVSRGRKPRVRHPAAHMIAKNKSMQQRQLGVSADKAKGLSEAKIRVINRARVAAATKTEQEERTEAFKGINKHFRHKTTVALHDHWMQRCGVSAKERAKLGSVGKVREANQSRALIAMEAQRKAYLHAQALDDASEKEQRRENTQKAKAMAERERARRMLENKRHREQSNDTRRARQAKASAAMDQEQARRVHGHKQAAAHSDMSRRRGKKQASAAMDQEQARRVHVHKQTAAHSDMTRRRNQKQAAAMRDTERARLVHEVRCNEVHAAMRRKTNQRKVKADRAHEQAKRAHKWHGHAVHEHMARKTNQTAAAAARSQERTRLMAQNKTTVSSIKKGTKEHPHTKAMKFHKRTHHDTDHFE